MPQTKSSLVHGFSAWEELTPKQLNMLLFIMDEYRRSGVLTWRKIMEGLGMKSPNSIREALTKLKRLGFIDFVEAKGGKKYNATIRPICTIEVLDLEV